MNCRKKMIYLSKFLSPPNESPDLKTCIGGINISIIRVRRQAMTAQGYVLPLVGISRTYGHPRVRLTLHLSAWNQIRQENQ